MSILFPLAFFSGAPGPGELVVVFLVILILFGPRRLPEIARNLGKALAQLRRASHEFKDQIMRIDTPPVYDISPEPDEVSEPGEIAADEERQEPPPDAGDDREQA